MLQLSSVLSSRLMNEARMQITHEFRPWNTNSSDPEVTVRNAGATVAIYGAQATGLSYGNIGYQFDDVRYQFVDNLTFVTGAHTAKFGVDSNLVSGETTFNAGWNGIYTFNSLTDYLARRPFEYRQFAGTGALDTTIQQVAFYVQDEWRIRPGLTISPGFRYEMAFLPDYQAATVPANRFPLATSIPDDKDLMAPRLGLVWDSGNNGKTIVRAASGIFYASPYMPVFEQSILSNGGNPDLSSLVIVPTTSNPNAVNDAFRAFGIDLASADLAHLPVFTTAQLNQLQAPENRVGQTVNYIDPNFRLPRATHVRVSLEHEIANGLIASVDFTNINTGRIARVRNINLAAAGAGRHGSPGLHLGASVRAAIRSGSGHGAECAVELPRDDRGSLGQAQAVHPRRLLHARLQPQPRRHRARHQQRGVRRRLQPEQRVLVVEHRPAPSVRRQCAGVSAARDRTVFDRARELGPSVQPAGRHRSEPGRRPRDRPVIDGVVIPRNTYRNKGFSQVDLRVQRGFNLPGSARAMVSLELFNLFNAANVEIGSANMVYGPGTIVQNGALVTQAPPANFGQIKDANGNYLLNSTLRTAPFQAQFGLRLQF